MLLPIGLQGRHDGPSSGSLIAKSASDMQSGGTDHNKTTTRHCRGAVTRYEMPPFFSFFFLRVFFWVVMPPLGAEKSF